MGGAGTGVPPVELLLVVPPLLLELELEEVEVEIGRASCRESVSVRVDLGGRRIITIKICMLLTTHHMSVQHHTMSPPPLISFTITPIDAHYSSTTLSITHTIIPD